MAKIQRALISVSDKVGLIPFVQILASAGIEIISTGGTAKALRDAGLVVKDISEHTGFPEMLDGRVKTLHPKVHGGLLYIRGNDTHEAAVKAHDIAPIDLVVVNLYPFEATVAKPDVSLHDAIENIDIGGPSMLRSAAKNHDSVTVIVDPADYADVAKQISANGDTTLELRRQLAAKVFARTAAYDGAIAAHLQKEFSAGKNALPAALSISAPLVQLLRCKCRIVVPHQGLIERVLWVLGLQPHLGSLARARIATRPACGLHQKRKQALGSTEIGGEECAIGIDCRH